MINVVELDERIEKCLSILHDNPRSRIFAALADAYRRRGEVGRAFSICKNGLRIHPKYGAAHIVMARLYLHQRMIEQARESVNKAIEAEGQSRATDFLLAEIHLETGELQKAREILKRLAADGGKDAAWKSLHERLGEYNRRSTPPPPSGSPTPVTKPEPAIAVVKPQSVYCATADDFISELKKIPRLIACAVRQGTDESAITTCSPPEETRVIAEEFYTLHREINQALTEKGWGPLAVLRVENTQNQWCMIGGGDVVAMLMGLPRLGYAAALRRTAACLEQLVESDNFGISESPSRSVSTDQTAE